MKRLRNGWKLAIAALLLVCAAPLLADEFGQGMTAYRARDYKTAWDTWMPLAEAGDASAQYGIAVMYENGHGVTKDEAKALEWYLKAAEQGDANAQFMAGVIYGRGEAVPYDVIERLKWYHKAADQGHVMAQFFLAMSYFEGNGAPQDSIVAYLWGSLALENSSGSQAQTISRYLDGVIATLSDEQVTEGQRRVGVWHRAHSGEGDTVSLEGIEPAAPAGPLEPSPLTSEEDARRVAGAWRMRVARQPTSVATEVGDDAYEYVVTFDYASDGTLVGTIRLPDGTDDPLDRAFAEGPSLSFTFRDTEAAGTLSEDGTAISGAAHAQGGKDRAFVMSRVAE